MARTRGYIVELLDHDKLSAACAALGIGAPSFFGNAVAQNPDGVIAVISTEGVSKITDVPDGHVCVDTQSFEWQYLPIEVVNECRTGETVDLADHIRTFGSRLDVNHLVWREWIDGEN